MPQLITAPGEAVVNRYRTSVVTPRVDAQVVKRHVQLGDHVDAGQALVTLSSVAMATAQGALLEADTELRRVKQLGRDVVSEKRFVTAQVAYQQARAQVGAYGMSDRQIDALIRQGDAARADGRFQLLAPQAGTVINDPFVIGQIVAPGYELLRITDESRIWVEARLPVNEAEWIMKDVAAIVTVGDTQLNGKVVQLHHQLDDTTRTRAVHIEVANPDHRLHPGQFVNVVIEGKAQQAQQGIVVPKAAVMRSKDGDWQVFVETAPGRFEAKEVALLRTAGERVMIDGIAPGTTVVARGAFFVQSEIAKGGFEIHNH
ncbi:RND transporter [Candidatus Tenderia electrophaga]|uniref:RND transporter n=1 Tax=Candidatus Tenderia electrophaga TaxID=1748243 RepID=A0A0S2THX3_9GAMM|nr:RND transporter [Candidatus Tenderia electrophaga]